jgi:hypothetical protein
VTIARVSAAARGHDLRGGCRGCAARRDGPVNAPTRAPLTGSPPTSTRDAPRSNAPSPPLHNPALAHGCNVHALARGRTDITPTAGARSTGGSFESAEGLWRVANPWKLDTALAFRPRADDQRDLLLKRLADRLKNPTCSRCVAEATCSKFANIPPDLSTSKTSRYSERLRSCSRWWMANDETTASKCPSVGSASRGHA